MGYAVLYLSLLVLIPLAALPIKSASLGWQGFWDAVASPRVVASYKLTFGASLIAALVNLVFGTIVAWVLVRYRFRARRSWMRWWICLRAAHRRRRHRADRAVFGKGLAGRAAGRVVRLEGRVHAVGHRDRADLHRRALRGAHGAACARGRRARDRGSRRQPGRQSLADHTPCAAARAAAGADDRLRAGLRARVGEYGSVVFIAGNMPMVSRSRRC